MPNGGYTRVYKDTHNETETYTPRQPFASHLSSNLKAFNMSDSSPFYLTHPSHKDVAVPEYYSEGDTLTDADSRALNMLKMMQAFTEASKRGITVLELPDFVHTYMNSAQIMLPKIARKRTPVEREARKLVIAAFKIKYRERGLSIKSQTQVIEHKADEIELGITERHQTVWKQYLATAAQVLGTEEDFSAESNKMEKQDEL